MWYELLFAPCLLSCCPLINDVISLLFFHFVYLCVSDGLLDSVSVWVFLSRRAVTWSDGVLCVAEFRSPSHVSGLNRSASLSCTERVDSVSISGSNSQLNTSPAAQYIPDFNVRALTDLQYVKVRHVHKQLITAKFGLVFTQMCLRVQKRQRDFSII